MADQPRTQGRGAKGSGPGRKSKGSRLDNCSCFLLPLQIRSRKVLDSFLRQSRHWEEERNGFPTQYTLYYAGGMNRPDDDRFRMYRYNAARELPLCTFRERIDMDLSSSPKPVSSSGCSPAVDGISLYVFGSGVAFLEVRVLYGQMNVCEIVEFVNLFRSLRNDESRSNQLRMPPDTISLRTAAARILPAEESGTVLCFSNPSEIKMQAIIYSFLQTSTCGIGVVTDKGAGLLQLSARARILQRRALGSEPGRSL